MPDGPLFSDDPVGTTAQLCGRQAKKAPAAWDVACVLKIMCPKDKAIVDQLAKTKIVVVDDNFYDDPFFNGKKWTTKRFPAGGGWNGTELVVRSDTTCEGAADTLFHELWHKNQPPGMGWPEPSEDDAYFNTEQWLIDRGLPGEPAFRKKDPVTGKTVPDKKAIRDFVQSTYPGPPPPIKGKKQPIPVGKDAKKNQTLVEDPVTGKTSWRASKKGDTFAGPETRVNEKISDPAKWSCP